MKEKQLLEKAKQFSLLSSLILFSFSVKSMLNRNLIIHIQHINLKWFNKVKKDEKIQCERNVWNFTSREPLHFSWAVSVTLLEDRFVPRAKHWATPWGSAQVQGAAPLPWAEFSSVPAAKLTLPTSSSWLLWDEGCSFSPRPICTEDGSWRWYFKLLFSLQVPFGLFYFFFLLPHCFTLAIFNYREYQKILPQLENRFALKWHLPILLIYTLFLHWSAGRFRQLYLT